MFRQLILIPLFLLSQLCSGEFEPAYLKLCGKEQKHFVDSYQCEKGIWLRQPIQPGCVCVRGVWALSNGFCDEHAAILVGDGNCFHVSFQIHSAKLIGDAKDPFKPSVYHMPRSVDTIFELKEDGFTPPIQNDETILVGVNPRQVAQRKDRKLCVDLEPENYAKPVHVFVTARRSEKEWTLDKKKQYNCPGVEGYHYHVGFGEMFVDNRVKPKLMVERNCKSQCPSGSIEPTPTAPKKASNKTKAPLGRWLTGPKKAFKTIGERNEEREELRAQFTQQPSHYEKEVNEQTLRMMHAHISSVLLNIPSRQVVTKEYRYFQQIRKVVEKACPQDFVPKLVITGLMRMFRQLLWETQDGYFQHSQNNDQGLFDRIMERLQECEEKSPDPSVFFATYTDSYKKNSTPPMVEPKPERCPVPIIFAVNGSAYNRTHMNEVESLFIRNFTYIFQPHLKFNGSQVDFVVETAWKIAMIGHYRCSKYFDDQTAIEFSQFFSQIQSFFNPRIIKRWYFPKSVEATYDIVKMMFPSYDLKKFMFGLDSCLFGTQGFSYFDFSNVWLQRPKVPMTANDLSQKKFVLPGATSRISTLDYAPDKHSSKAKPGGGAGVKLVTTGGSRKKREIGGGYYLWNQQARCLDDYLDPLRRGDFGYYPPRGCIPPVASNEYDY